MEYNKHYFEFGTKNIYFILIYLFTYASKFSMLYSSERSVQVEENDSKYAILNIKTNILAILVSANRRPGHTHSSTHTHTTHTL